MAVQVTLVTQCSTDRLSALKAQVLSWGGPVSVAVYVSTASASDMQAQLRTLHDTLAALHRQDGDGRLSYRISVVLGREAKQQQQQQEEEEAGSWLGDEAAALYPVNTMRNVALAQALSDPLCQHVFLVDADFVPCPAGLCDRLTPLLLEEDGQPPSAGPLVVPAFNLHPSLLLQDGSSQLDLQQLDKAAMASLYREGRAWGFHTPHFPRGHGPTDFDQWLQPAHSKPRGWYSVLYQEYFEPYIVRTEHPHSPGPV